MAIFSDLANEFQMLDYTSTHDQLLIRSMKNKNRNYIVDIIIKGVLHLVIPSVFKGLEISIAEKKENNKSLVEELGFKTTKDYKIFLLTDSKGKKFFLNAMCFGIYQNKLDILETSLGR